MHKLTSNTLHFLCALLFTFTLYASPFPLHAQGPSQAPPQYTAIIQTAEDIPSPNQDPNSMWANQPTRKYSLTVTSGDKSGQTIDILQTIPQNPNLPPYKTGDPVIITSSQNPNGQDGYYISDFQRSTTLLWLSLFFAALTILIARKRGLLSLVGMAISFLILFFFTIPQIMRHQDPVLITILTSLILVPITFYLSHGLNFKTTSAIVSTFIALIVTGILATLMVDQGRLTGFTNDEVSFLQLQLQGSINIKGLLLAGIIISTLGILDDVTVSQSAIVTQLKKTSPNLKLWDLYHKAMDIGHDHIASAVNTLILVYTGASLPLLLLFVVNSANPVIALNYEIVAEEIIRTLVASIGLVLAVPIATLLSAYFESRR